MECHTRSKTEPQLEIVSEIKLICKNLYEDFLLKSILLQGLHLLWKSNKFAFNFLPNEKQRKQRKNKNNEKHHKRRDTGEDLSKISSRIARLSPFVAREDDAAPDSTTNWRSLVAVSSDKFPCNHWRPNLWPSATRRRHVLAMVAESVIRKWQCLLAIPHDHSLQPQSEKQNIKRVYRIFASCARFLYVKHARETLSLETSGLGHLQMKQSLKCMCTHGSKCWSPLFCIHREKAKSLLRVPQLATQ